MNLQSLSLKLSDFRCLFPILYHTPNLKYLNVLLSILVVKSQANPNIDFSQIKLTDEIVSETLNFRFAVEGKFCESIVCILRIKYQINRT
jgi:hypothetical protein